MLSIKAAFLPKQATLIAGGMADTVFVMAYLSVIMGLLLASPVIFYEIIAFIKPALYDNEKKVVGYYLGGFIGTLALGENGVFPYYSNLFSNTYLLYNAGRLAAIHFHSGLLQRIFTLFVVCGVFYTIPVFIVMLVHVGVLPMKYLRGRNKIIVYVIILMLFGFCGSNSDYGLNYVGPLCSFLSWRLTLEEELIRHEN